MALAANLEGKILGKWRIIEKRIKTATDNSGAFSSCYKVENTETGTQAFLKAINYTYAFNQLGRPINVSDFLRDMSSLYTYERDLSLFCQDRKMSRIVTAIDHGEYSEPGNNMVAPYLVFNFADGSLKNMRPLVDPDDLAWQLTAFHGCLVGLSQLHLNEIVHQDIKPSNILVFGHKVSRLADLGNATRKGVPSPRWDLDGHCGDISYAPIELLYNYYSTDWDTRRFGADLFMVGSILVYLISGLNMQTLFLSFIPSPYNFMTYGGTFEQVKPALMEAYQKSLAEISLHIPLKIRAALMEVIAQLCHPVPEERGNPQNIYSSATRYSLQRYISIIDRLAKTMEIEQHLKARLLST